MSYKNSIKRVFFIVLLNIAVLNTMSMLDSNKVHAERKVIKVAYPIIEGFTEIIDNEYSGYIYEYLREIAKFTGWKYEFIETTLNESILMLKKGEVDIAGGAVKNPYTEEIFDFPEYTAGNTYSTLAVLRSNTKIGNLNYESMNGIKVGVFETANSTIDSFKKFCEQNNIKDVEIIKYKNDDPDKLNNALQTEEVDAILGNNLLINEDQKIVVRFNPQSHYFATTKDNSEIINGLNYALSRIKELNPEYSEKLYQKYFNKQIEYTLSLTENEQNYLKNMDVLKVTYVDNVHPIQNWNDSTKQLEGVAIDVMLVISEKLGIDIEWIKSKDYDEAFNNILDDTADVFIAAPHKYSYADKYEISLTKPYLELSPVLVINKHKPYEEISVIAVPKSYRLGDLSQLKKVFGEVLVLEDISQCMEAVDQGRADIMFSDTNNITFETQLNHYNNIKLNYSINDVIGTSIGIRDDSDIELLSILNKSILSITDEDINQMLYENVSKMDGKMKLSTFINYNSKVIISIITTLSLLVLFLVYIIYKLRLKDMETINRNLEEKVAQDALTGVYNNKHFEQLIKRQIDLKYNQSYSTLLIIDIDNFKIINDLLGHRIGDNVIKDLTNKIKQIFREEDILGRLGGDEFKIYMANINEYNIHMVAKKAEKLCSSMNTTIISNDGSVVDISISIGICIFKRKTTFAELYDEADKVLYDVKKCGKNNYKIKIID